MLVLSRCPGESIQIGEDIKITIIEFRGSRIRVGIECPKGIRILRTELLEVVERQEEQDREEKQP